ncbi:MAG: zinc metallopeptidase [Acidobacteriota bacterium]|nr:zinc metallopeptidase [Acidobacteriota bacterium]
MLEEGESSNIEDRRGMGGRGMALGGGGLGTLLIILAVWLCGGDPSALLNQMGGGSTDAPAYQQPQQQANPNQPQNDAEKKFISSVLKSTETVWAQELPRQARIRYTNPTLVLFNNRTPSACGQASSATGPFYCPGDGKLYLDFAFFDELKTRFGAPGDFAQAYVVAHEVGHHVQDLLGTMDKVQSAGNSNQMSVNLELQADCYAGVWGFYAKQKGLLEAGDAEEALKAASAVGDDNIQRKTQGYVRPDSFTHGSAADRMRWFNQGFQSGQISQCNTFGTR